MENFGKNLKDIRVKKGFTGKELSNQIRLKTGFEISQRSLSGYENNQRDPSLKALICLSRTLEVSIDTLVGNESFSDQNPTNGDVMNKLDEIRTLIAK